MPKPLECFRLDPSDGRWLTFISTHPCSNIFHHPAWINTLSECYGYRPFVIAVGDPNGDICAGMPMMLLASPLAGKHLVALPFTDHCQPLYRDTESLTRLTQELISLAQSGRKSRIQVRAVLPDDPAIQKDLRYVQHTLQLEPDIKQVLGRLHRTQRQNIGTAEKKGVRIQWGKSLEDASTFYGLQCLTRRRLGVPVQPRKFFDLIFNNVIEKGLGFILLAYADDECVAAGLFLHWNQSLTYKYSASSDQGHELRPNHLLTWTAIRWGCENHFGVLDFGRTDLADDGLRTFKKRWGAVETPMVYSALPGTHSPSSSDKLTHIVQPILQRSPVWVNRIAGELVYRHFGYLG